ncbi:MAG: sensor histidine kinase, partial [Magnetococcales bacterium]|nr:sensor histidine kinase [Magnetococcales bacterium]
GKSAGVGLGTYSARLIATTLGGDIQLDATQEGRTTLLIRLPVCNTARESHAGEGVPTENAHVQSNGLHDLSNP